MGLSTSERSGLLCGCAAVDVTPPLGCSLAGYFHDRRALSVRDPLYARAIALWPEDGELAQGLVFVSMDLVAISRELTSAAKCLVASRLGIPEDRILISATHTHTGPEVRDARWVSMASDYRERLPGLIAEAVENAVAAPFPATLRPGTAEVDGYAFNRITRRADASEVFGGQRGGAECLGPAGPVDPELHATGITDAAGELRALLVNFGLHVDVIGGGLADFVSADWPGEMAATVSRAYDREVVTVFLQGTCGHINQNPYDATRLPTSGPAKAAQLGRGLAGAAMMAWERAEPMEDTTLAASLMELSIPYYTRDAELMAHIEALKKLDVKEYFEQAQIDAVEDWPYDGQTAKVLIQCVRLGDVALVGFPAEVFTGLGLELKRWSPAAKTLVVTLANDAVSNYIPTTDQAERGGYGAMPILSRFLVSDAGRRMVDSAGTVLQALFAPTA